MNEPKKASQVSAMFSGIARRYDLANTILSLGIDHLWRIKLVSSVASNKNLRVLDLCCGTGALLPLLARRFGPLTGVDFCPEMLELAKRHGSEIRLIVADALHLPFEAASFDLITIAFGVRNFEHLDDTLREVSRVLAPGGTLLILEFGQPKNRLWRSIFRLYSQTILPFLGGLITGQGAAYRYLQRTAASFPCGEAFIARLTASGFENISATALTGGVAYIYSAKQR